MRIILILTSLCFYCCAPQTKQNKSVPIATPIVAPVIINTDTLNPMITGTMYQEATDAGWALLDSGGSAVDAALSVALSQIAKAGGKWISYAGMFNMVYYEAQTGKIYNLNASFNTVQNETDPSSIPFIHPMRPKNDTPSTGRTVLVPGFMKGIGAAHARFGKLPFEKIFNHAIEVAENGVIWTDLDSTIFSLSKNIVTNYPETRAVFTKEDGSFYKPGDVFKQPKLETTLRSVASKGTDYIYTGPWAEKFVKTVRDAGGKMTMKDMEDYEVIWSEPVHGTYHGYDIYTHGAPAIGGAMLLEKLNLAEAARLSDRGSYTQSPEALYILYLISTAVAGNYSSFDPTILTKEHAAKKWKQIAAKKKLDFEKQTKYKSEHSASVVTTDRWGNMAAITHSINTVHWGTNGLFVDGISIPDPACFQQYVLRSLSPGSRLPEGTCPGLVFKEGKPILGFSCVGSGLLNQSAFSLVNILDFNMTPQEATDTASIGYGYFHDNKTSLIIEPKKFSEKVLKEATELGGSFVESNTVLGGFWSGVLRNYETGEVQATKVMD